MTAVRHHRDPTPAARAGRIRPALAIGLLAGAMSGCAGGSDTERGAQRLFDGIGHGLLGHRSNQEQVLVPVEGLVNVEVRNFAGQVIVRGDRGDRAHDALVVFDRRATHEAGRGDESESSLPQIEWKAELVPAPEPGGVPTLRVTTSTTHGEPWFQQVDIEVLVAQLGRVDVVTTRGKVDVCENRGPVDLVTTKGGVRVITPWPQTKESVVLTREGDIEFRVRGESAFVLDAETVGGTVYSRCDAGRWLADHARNDHDSMVATINGGTSTVTLRTVDGNIRVAVTGDPHGVGNFATRP